MMYQSWSGDGTRLYHPSQPAEPSASAATSRSRPLRGMDHLHGAGIPERLLEGARIGGSSGDEDPDAVIAEARVIGDLPAGLEQREEGDGKERRERPDEDGQLEGDDDIGRDRRDRLAADQHRPV